MSNNNGEGGRTCLLSVTNKRKIISTCGVDRGQARSVLSIVSIPRADRIETASVIKKILDGWKARYGGVKHDARIQISYKKKNIVVSCKNPLHWRVCHFIMMACLSDNNEGIRILKLRLTEFIGGKPGDVVLPFWEADQGKLIKL